MIVVSLIVIAKNAKIISEFINSYSAFLAFYFVVEVVGSKCRPFKITNMIVAI